MRIMRIIFHKENYDRRIKVGRSQEYYMAKIQQSHTSEMRLARTSFCLVQSKSESISKKQKIKMKLKGKGANRL